MEDEMKVLIIAIGKCRKNSPEAQIIAEYIKRSGWEVVVKEKDNATQAEEAKFLQESIPAGAKVIVLDERGENIKSLELAHRIENWMLNGCSEICFLIGGADGHSVACQQLPRQQEHLRQWANHNQNLPCANRQEQD